MKWRTGKPRNEYLAPFHLHSQIRKLEQLYEDQNLGEFHRLVNQVTKIKDKPCPIRSLEINGNVIQDQSSILNAIADYLEGSNMGVSSDPQGNL